MDKILAALAGHLRAMQLYYHKLHNLSQGAAFFSDHTMFGEFYAEVERDYDEVVEWAVSLGNEKTADPVSQMKAIHAVLDLDDAEEMEAQLQDICDMAKDDKDCTLGLEQLVGTIAQHSNVRAYKLGRRAK